MGFNLTRGWSAPMLTCLLFVILGCQSGGAAAGLAPPEGAPPPPADSTPPPPAPPDTIPTPPAAPDTTLPPAGRPLSPHWDHIRTAHTDFHYNLTDAERNWMAAHYDMIMGGDADEWKPRNPGMIHTSYDLVATVEQSGGRMDRLTQWFASVQRNPDGHPLESAFLHRPGEPASPGSRLTDTIWGTARFLLNPSDPGYRNYVTWLLADRVAKGYDGLFFDEFAEGNLRGNWPSDELATEATYATAFEGLFGAMHAGSPGGRIVVNTATYAKPLDQRMLDAAGGGHLEGMNNPLHGSWVERWAWAETQLARGHLVEWVGGRTTADALPPSYGKGNAPSPMHRLKLTELAGYYLLRPTDPSSFLLDLRIAWNQLPSQQWLRAVERDVGRPTEARRKLATGTDALGRKYDIWVRAYERALVVVRPQVGWDAQDYDGGAVSVALPAGTWRALRPDGGLGPVLPGLSLRVAEGVVLFHE